MEKQAGHTEQQTGLLSDSIAVARRAADSAKESADVSKTAERAWLLDVLQDVEEIPPAFVQFAATITFINRGRTVAKVTDLSIRCMVIAIVDDGSDILPETPDYEDQIYFELGTGGLILAPEQAVTFTKPLETFVFDVTERELLYRTVPAIPMRLVVYGRVVYNDGFTDGRTTNSAIFGHSRKLGFYQETGVL